MIVVGDLRSLRHWVGRWHRDELSVALVPTMGNLHEGHLELVRRARDLGERVVASLFVNPLQFGPGEDYDSYPRSYRQDRELLEAEGVHLLFAPPMEEVYPRPLEAQARVKVPGLSDILCGASRPGHFAGVATVVCKLLNMVQPELAVFGEKDFQQLLVLRRMVEDLAFPVEMIGVPTVREADGLALSSRNTYLTPEERARAPALFAALREAAAALEAGGTDPATVERVAAERLAEAGMEPDYVSVRRADDLTPAGADDEDLVVLAAAYLGQARLIDNLRVRR